MSISPKDFWNRRWNRAVSRMFHRFMFSKVSAKKGKQAKHQSFLMSSPTVCGLGVFFVSGLFHDFMIAAATRILTFEMTLFFMIHGIAVALEVNLFRKRIPPYSMTSRILCQVLTILFFVTTGRLFLSPILQNQVFLRIANWF
ncbi:hypothetical protein CU098_003821 [Rhizopus stolonifer]|uniref:Wax synthase domain-containing protein n=1 Tax=Rhizopus stolonifer TaxID=4846 RepID=A0A367IJF6_RHIST|nr:hypothetical protein CU098_003821 [Rhizopus stolonifer]